MKGRFYKVLNLIFIIFVFLSSRAYGDTDNLQYIDIKLTRPLVEKNIINCKSENGFSIYTVEDKLNSSFDMEVNEIKVVLDEMEDISLLDIQGNLLFTIPKESNLLLKSNDNQDFNYDQESTIMVEKDRYRGYLRFKPQNGQIILINHIEMEDYLYGLIPKEMPHTFPMEALKAQAIAARTYASYNMDKHLSEGFNLCDTTHCQVYYGYECENPSTNLAVDETKGILAYYDGELIDAQYHSTSSGFTEDSINVWGGDKPYLKSIKDDFSTDSPYSNWTLRLDEFDLNNKLASNKINIGLLKSIEIIESSPSGSVKRVKLVGSSGEQVISGTDFRRIIGSTTLKSTWFNISNGNLNNGGSINTDKKVYIMGKDGKPISKRLSEVSVLERGVKKSVSRSGVSRAINRYKKTESLLVEESVPAFSTSEIIIEGKGYGHCVGMSQYGAKKMAELGYTFEEILKHYYTGIDIL